MPGLYHNQPYSGVRAWGAHAISKFSYASWAANLVPTLEIFHVAALPPVLKVCNKQIIVYQAIRWPPGAGSHHPPTQPPNPTVKGWRGIEIMLFNHHKIQVLSSRGVQGLQMTACAEETLLLSKNMPAKRDILSAISELDTKAFRGTWE